MRKQKYTHKQMERELERRICDLEEKRIVNSRLLDLECKVERLESRMSLFDPIPSFTHTIPHTQCGRVENET